ncbi:MAG TPA: BON domain-containing protein [Chitinispirillaceae bacterium]|nr:BON domain-containing protein [Chitinispirillaceae bacterium]
MAYTDDEMKRIIIDQLSWDYRIGMSAIEVNVHNGEVTLEGTVPSYAARQAAEADVLQVPGVTGVKDKMALKFPSNLTIPSDSEIQIRLLNRFLWNPNIEASSVDVTVDKGTVILRGTTDAYWKKMRAEEIAYDIQGVVHVSNELVVVPTHAYQDKAIAEDIIAALQRNFDLDHQRIEIDIDNGLVTLSGTVHDMRELYNAYRIARFTRGVRDVVNLLKVQQKAA